MAESAKVFQLRNKALVDQCIPAPAPDDPNAQLNNLKRKVLDDHAPTLVKEGHRRARAEIADVIKAATDAAVASTLAEVNKAHGQELVSTELIMDKQASHRVSAARGMWLAIGILAGAGIGVVGTQRVMKDGMFGLVAASRSASDVWTPPQELNVREVPRCENTADCPALDH